MLPHHATEAVAIGQPLSARKLEGVLESVYDYGSARNTYADAGALKSPPQLNILTRAESLIESVLEQRFSIEDGRDNSKPVLAPAGPVMVDECAAPVPRAGHAQQPRLQSNVPLIGEFFDELSEGSLGQYHVCVDQGNKTRMRGARPHHSGGGKAAAMIMDDSYRVPPSNLKCSVGRHTINDDDLSRLRARDRVETSLDQMLSVTDRYHDREIKHGK